MKGCCCDSFEAAAAHKATCVAHLPCGLTRTRGPFPWLPHCHILAIYQPTSLLVDRLSRCRIYILKLQMNSRHRQAQKSYLHSTLKAHSISCHMMDMQCTADHSIKETIVVTAFCSHVEVGHPEVSCRRRRRKIYCRMNCLHTLLQSSSPDS